jgi:hypothetical protein
VDTAYGPIAADEAGMIMMIGRKVPNGSQYSDDSHNDVCLDFGDNLATAMLVCKR